MTPARILLLPLATCAACVAPQSHQLLQVGSFVEAKGVLAGGNAVVTEVDPVARSADDKRDKVEVTGPTERADAGVVALLGHAFTLDANTDYEDADKRARPPFTPAVGDWLRVKARSDEHGLRARTVREAAPRDQFKVTGEVRHVDPRLGTIDVGGITLPLAPDADLGLRARRDPNDPLSLFLADDQKAVPFGLRLGESVLLGGQAAAEYEYDDEFDLDDTRARDRSKPAIRGKVDALWLWDDNGSYALGEVTFGRDDTIRENDVDTHEDKLELSRGYASLAVADDVQVIVGRQDFDEEREWLYDEVLDGARAVLHAGAWQFELGGAVGREVAAEPNATEDTGLLVGNVRWQLDRDWELGAYVLRRSDDNAAGFEPLLYGMRSFAFPRYGFGHWLELGAAAGDDGARAIRGYAFDVGVLYTFDTAWRPTVGAGLAFGSGRADGASEVGYRQSGLQDNNQKLGGVTSVRYYGELLDPELANLTVTTLCASVRPLRGASLSVLFHTYRQDVAAATQPDTQLRVLPTGTDRDLGREIDLVLGYRLERRLTLELVAARFDAGGAFVGDTAANLLTLTARLSF